MIVGRNTHSGRALEQRFGSHVREYASNEFRNVLVARPVSAGRAMHGIGNDEMPTKDLITRLTSRLLIGRASNFDCRSATTNTVICKEVSRREKNV